MAGVVFLAMVLWADVFCFLCYFDLLVECGAVQLKGGGFA